MKIASAEYFYTNYVGYHPDDKTKADMTRDMIAHYVESGLEKHLPDIYERCAKDEVLNQHNIPHDLWEEGNLIKTDRFYLSPALSLLNKPPVVNMETGEVITQPYFREIKEFFSIEDIMAYAGQNLKRTSVLVDAKMDEGAVKHLLGRYKGLREEGIEPLDMVMFLIGHHKGESIPLIAISEGDEEVLQMVRGYREKLRMMDLLKPVWRGALANG